jgi:hypothetical protein
MLGDGDESQVMASHQYLTGGLKKIFLEYADLTNKSARRFRNPRNLSLRRGDATVLEINGDKLRTSKMPRILAKKTRLSPAAIATICTTEHPIRRKVSEPAQAANRALRSHPVKRSVSGVARQVGSEKQAKSTAELPNEPRLPPNCDNGDPSLTPEGYGHMVCAKTKIKLKSEIPAGS